MASLTKVLSEILRIGADKIAPETAIHKVDTWNSLTHIELILALEETFHVQLTQDEIVAMTSVDAIRTVLRKRGVSPE